MALDVELAGVLREVVQFLECLREVKLPVTLESIRDNLLVRSKDSLTSFMAERIGRPISPEAYLNMNAGSKGLLPTKMETELQEYVDAENSQVQKQKQQDHYETFQEIEPTSGKKGGCRPSIVNGKQNEDREMTLADIYAGMSAAQTKIKCQKCGTLYRKEGKKLFVFEQYRACWAGLLGSHLLIYANDRESHPYSVQTIRGYMARPAPNFIPRDQRRSESAFEIFRPGSRTLQFVARTPKDMEQWVAKICQIGCAENEERIATDNERKTTPVGDTFKSKSDDNDAHRDDGNGYSDGDSPGNDNDVNGNDNGVLTETLEELPYNEERYQDVGSIDIHKTSEENSIVPGDTDNHCKTSSPPPLPARIPRRLPSVLNTGTTLSQEQPDDEDDDIYHKIEDLRESVCYQNLKKGSKTKDVDKEPGGPFTMATTYDDVRTTTKERTLHGVNLLTKNNTYDDIGSTVIDRDTPASYDDVENLARNVNLSGGLPTQDTNKSPQKKSFLDRVRSRKGSPRKVEKKAKPKTPTPSSTNIKELSTYDDVSDLISPQECKPCEIEFPEYNCPPPPRPVTGKPVPDAIEDQEMVYDDVGACREKYEEEMNKKLNQKIPGTLENHGTALVLEKTEDTIVEENMHVQLVDEIEHYQTPRSESCKRGQIFVDQQEKLYDDIALLADFRARQKESFDKKEFEDSNKYQESHDKKTWNRFVSTRKMRWSESSDCETTARVFGEVEDVKDHGEHRSFTRMNTLQKLMSKMENSLGKSSARMASSTPSNKINIANDT